MRIVATCEECGAELEDGAIKSAGKSASQPNDDSPVSKEQEPRLLCKRCAGEIADDESSAEPQAVDASDNELSDATKIVDADVPAGYEILRKFSRCKSGKAYQIRAEGMTNDLIIRFVNAGVAKLTGGRSIEKCAQTLVSHNSPNLQAVFDWRTDSSMSYFLMEAAPSNNLEDLIKAEGFLDLPRAIDLFVEVCEALEDLHSHKLIHGHIRPKCICFSTTGSGIDSVKVTNFSITNVRSNHVEQPVKIGRNYTCNDAFYMNPEEIRSQMMTPLSDIYSLGCVMFHAITGKPVFRAKDHREAIDLHIGSAPARFRQRYEVPPTVEEVVLHMLEKDPSKRYRSVKAIKRDLQRIRDRKEPIIDNFVKELLSKVGQ